MQTPVPYQLLSKLYLNHAEGSFITPERIELLQSIQHAGSISAGAKEMGKSYKWAWDSIDQMNTHAGRDLVERSSGGKGGGGAKVTPFAIELLTYYHELERIHQEKIERYQVSFNHAFQEGKFTTNIASTLQGQVKTLERNDSSCELTIAYGETLLQAKCQQNLGIKLGSNIDFMVESNQIIIAKEAVSISAQNLLVGTVSLIQQESNNVYLDLLLETREILRVLITPQSLQQFDLKLGDTCFAYFKTYNITILGETH